MASTRIYYYRSWHDYAKGESKHETLCFICAVKSALASDPEDGTIEIVSTDYEPSQCAKCDSYIHDTIEI